VTFLNLVRALDDSAQQTIDDLDVEIREAVDALYVLYAKRAALQALRDIRAPFNGDIA